MKRTLLLPLLLFAACAGQGDGGDPAPQEVADASPLGVGHPDPMAIVTRAARAMEEGDWPAACRELADLGRSGRPVPLVPGQNVPESLPESMGRRIRPFFEHLRGLDRPWLTVRYGPVRTVRNDPPVVAVTVLPEYDYDAVTPTERTVILHNWSKEVGREGTWPEFVREMERRRRARERSGDRPTWTFAWLDDRWRLYVGPPL